MTKTQTLVMALIASLMMAFVASVPTTKMSAEQEAVALQQG